MLNFVPAFLRRRTVSKSNPIKPEAGVSGRWFKRSGASLQGTLSNWVNQIISNRISEAERRKVADRAWDLYINDAMAHGIIEGLITEVVGTGLTPQAQPMLTQLGQTIEWQQEYQQKVADLYDVWGMDSRCWCDAQRRQNIYMLQALALFQWKLDGIAVFQVRWKRERYAPLSLCLLPIDPARLITPFDLQNKAYLDIYDGLELDRDGAIRAAWIVKQTQQSAYGKTFSTARSDECLRIPVTNEATGLPNMLLTANVRNVAEYRQDSIFGSLIKELRDNSDFVEAAMVKALLSNLFALFVEDTYGTQNTSATEWADRVQELEKGTIIVGRQGEVPHEIKSDAPGPNFEMMFQSIIKRLGMATGRGPENVSREYNSSYSASQASMENAGKFDDVDRMTLVNGFCQPALSLMEYEAVLRGLLPVPNAEDFLANLHAYTRAQWQPPPLRPIDKLKAANADDVRLGNLTRSYADIFGEKSQDWRTGLRQIAIEKAYIEGLEEEYGVDLKPEKVPAPQPSEPDDSGKEDEDADTN